MFTKICEKKNKFSPIYILIVLIIIIIISGSIIYKSESINHLTIYELQADYDQFWQIIEESFPFYPLLGDEHNLYNIRANNRLLIGKSVKNVAGLYSLLESSIRQISEFPHFQMIHPLFYEEYKNQSIHYGIPELELLLNPQTQKTYSLLVKNYPETNRKIYSDFDKILSETIYYPDIQTAYFKFPSFLTPFVNNDMDSPIATFLYKHPNTKHIIFDISGNSGGNTEYWQYYIVSAFNESYTWSSNIFLKLTKDTSWLYKKINLEKIENLSNKELPPFVKKYGMTHYKNDISTYPLSDYKGLRVEGAQTRWLLVNSEVFSASDSFAKFCKDTGFAKLVGTTTKGAGSTVRGPVLCRLKNSGLLFRFPIDSSFNEKGLPSEVQGVIPDYFASPKSTPLETCLDIIKNLNNK